MKLRDKYYAIDFDNTIAYDAHPNIGDLIPGAKETINKIKDLGGKVVIWTCRSGSQAEEVKKFLKENDIRYDTFNEPFPEHVEEYGGDSRKVFACRYIDDRCILWGEDKIVSWSFLQKYIFEEN